MVVFVENVECTQHSPVDRGESQALVKVCRYYIHRIFGLLINCLNDHEVWIIWRTDEYNTAASLALIANFDRVSLHGIGC
jgi:hypothetical protein